MEVGRWCQGTPSSCGGWLGLAVVVECQVEVALAFIGWILAYTTKGGYCAAGREHVCKLSVVEEPLSQSRKPLCLDIVDKELPFTLCSSGRLALAVEVVAKACDGSRTSDRSIVNCRLRQLRRSECDANR